MKKIYFFLLLILISCDCLQEVSGIVIDAETKEPVSRACIITNAIGRKDSVFTDDKGYFEISKISGGFFKCPDVEVIITRNGFETQKAKIENNKDIIIRLKKYR